MLRRALPRLAQTLVVMWGVVTAMFLVVRALPGDPAVQLAGPSATPATITAIRAQYHLNQPVWSQYTHWLGQLLSGNLGTSITFQDKVTTLIGQSLQPSIQLLVAAMVIGVPLGVLGGVIAATHRRGPVDLAVSGAGAVVLGMPAFWTGLLTLLLFSVELHWLPSGGWANVFTDPATGFKTLALPAITLGAGVAAVEARFVRASMIEALSGDYVRTARAKGASERRVVWGHALRNALLPLITITGIQVGALLGGVVVIENVFARPGLGTLIANAISQRDYPVVQGVTLVMVAVFVLVNLFVDLTYSVIDPRIRR